MRSAVRETLARTLGSEVSEVRAASGGEINRAWRATLGDGRRVFVKTPGAEGLPQASGRRPAPFEAEARGLEWLRVPDGPRLPEVLATDGGSFLALEWVEPGRAGPESHAALGRQLAALHAAHPEGFGLDHDNLAGRVPQDNRPAPDWAAFYGERRLAPMLPLVRRELDAAGARRLEAVVAALPALVGPAEAPARLHGDLWGGNWLADSSGAPVLVDPACHGGHRELDLAMMRLFGGFSEACFAAYEEVLPLASGAPERLPLYQLWYLLVHLRLFGAGYASSVARALRACPL